MKLEKLWNVDFSDFGVAFYKDFKGVLKEFEKKIREKNAIRVEIRNGFFHGLISHWFL